MLERTQAEGELKPRKMLISKKEIRNDSLMPMQKVGTLSSLLPPPPHPHRPAFARFALENYREIILQVKRVNQVSRLGNNKK